MKHDLRNIAKRMVARGKGILAADESLGTIEKRFAAIKLASSEQTRRDYREILLRALEGGDEGGDAQGDAPANGREYVSGVILFEETLCQHAEDGTALVDVIRNAGALPGIKVDRGLVPLPGGGEGEMRTRGLSGLSSRLRIQSARGALFAKWRAVFHIGSDMPSNCAIQTNSKALAVYARQCQDVGLVPIVEPEVLMQGEHGIEQCAMSSAAVLNSVFAALQSEGVDLEAVVLKPNMVTSGDSHSRRDTPEEVAEHTLSCLRATVPAFVPGIAFLSGGQGDVEATANLNAINALAGKAPWMLTFSFGRALQAAALRVWGGKRENAAAAGAAFLHRAHMNAAACRGAWTPDMETPPQ